MKLNILLFSFIVLPLFLQCNAITQSKHKHMPESKSNATELPVATADTDVQPDPITDNNSDTEIKT